MRRALTEVAHRPWPIPSGPWIMAQTWHDLLFAHWRIDAIQLGTLRPLIPAALDIDTFQGEAWIGVVPFRMSGVRLRATPEIPMLSAFPELNVRTYVTHGGKPGVWFFSLDAANAIAVSIARAWFHLPYFRARMRCENRAGWIEYTSERTHRGAAKAKLRTRYRPTGEIFHAEPGTVEHFLTERYCLYAADTRGRVSRAEIQHPPWPLQPAQAEFRESTMIAAAGITSMEGGDPAPPSATSPPHPNTRLLHPTAPLLHFSARQDVLVWHPQSISTAHGAKMEDSSSDHGGHS
ncbi:MAG TPA: DUF2071 domain-containing protein [Candidatus Sulfotelmatobacter sp.]|nr:DUF2071 domain-containing protein [Candidatus Sulfotelmatobacter sp.]